MLKPAAARHINQPHEIVISIGQKPNNFPRTCKFQTLDDGLMTRRSSTGNVSHAARVSREHDEQAGWLERNHHHGKLDRPGTLADSS
jgi:hypothetical protein